MFSRAALQHPTLLLTVCPCCSSKWDMSSVSAPGGNTVASSPSYVLPQSTSDSSENSVHRAAFLWAWGYSTVASMTPWITRVDGLGRCPLSLLLLCACHVLSCRTDVGGAEMEKDNRLDRGGEARSSVRVERVVVFPARVSSLPWAPASISVKQRD